LIDYCRLIDSIENVGEGDLLDISSDLLSVIMDYRKNKIIFDPERLLDSFCEKVGGGGTVMIRTWNWDFCHNAAFDWRNTPSQVGALGNIALKRSDLSVRAIRFIRGRCGERISASFARWTTSVPLAPIRRLDFYMFVKESN
jgi:hypothetical protein